MLPYAPLTEGQQAKDHNRHNQCGEYLQVVRIPEVFSGQGVGRHHVNLQIEALSNRASNEAPTIRPDAPTADMSWETRTSVRILPRWGASIRCAKQTLTFGS